MKTTTENLYVIGVAIRTTNENGQSAADIPQLWNKFLSENIAATIPNKVNENIYCIYTDYESDHTKPYTTILGCRVSSLGDVPEGLTGKEIAGGDYEVITVKGKITDGIVFNEWVRIWNSDLPRAFTADYEVYGEKAQQPDNAEVDIFIALK